MKRCGNIADNKTIQYFTEHMQRIGLNTKKQKKKDIKEFRTFYKTRLLMYIKYVVIPISGDSASNISQSKIQSQHDVINTVFQVRHDVSGIPSSGRYNYRGIMGQPNIAFLPTNSDELTEGNGHIIRLSPVSNKFSEISQVENEFKNQGHTFEDGYIYVFISDLSADGDQILLGKAKNIPSNVCMINYKTVGSPTDEGVLANYNTGKTLCHELGHCFGLFHPFSSSPCFSSLTEFIMEQNPKYPRQQNPNYSASMSSLTQNGNGLDNRGRDFLRYCTNSSTCQANTTNGLNSGDSIGVDAYSCLSRSELASSSTLFEPFFVVMDYSKDEDLLSFSIYNVDVMRTTITNSTSLFKYSEDNNINPDPFADASDGGANENLAIPIWSIILISIGGLALIVIVVFIYLKKRKSHFPYFMKNNRI